MVIVIASYRASRMNIVSAVRNLPDRGGGSSRKGLRGIWRWALPSLVAIGGVALIVYATPGGLFSLALLGLTFVIIGAVMLVGRLLDRTQMRYESVERLVYTIIGLALLVLWIGPWLRLMSDTFPDLYEYSPIQLPILFLSSAIFIVVGAIMAIMVNADAIGWLFSRLLGFIPWMRPVLRTAVAYPLNTRFRTGMIMVLFAMIMASVVVMAVVIHATQSLVTLDEKQTGGFQIQVSPTLLSFFSPVDDFEALLEQQADDETLADVEQVGVIYRDVLRARTDGGEWLYAGINGLNAGYTEQAQTIYPLMARAPGYDSDEAVWQAIREGKDVAVILPHKLNERRTDAFNFESDNSEEFGPGGPQSNSREMWLNEIFFPDVQIVDGQLPVLNMEVKAIVDEQQGEVAEPRTLQIIGVLEDDQAVGVERCADECRCAEADPRPQAGGCRVLRQCAGRCGRARRCTAH